jgi:DNA-directed RNA polymerase I, II, and III subunit RPABC3
LGEQEPKIFYGTFEKRTQNEYLKAPKNATQKCTYLKSVSNFFSNHLTNLMRENNQIFQAFFEITDIDPHGKKFDRVSRIVATSDNILSEVTLDINTQIYPMQVGEKFTLLLVESLDGSVVDVKQKEQWKPIQKSLADDYDYVMYGKVYKYEDNNQKVSVYVSFGGLLMCLAGDYRALQHIQVGQYLYLVMRK